MMAARPAPGWGALAASLALGVAGCATVPQPALDQANNAANLMMALQGQLDTLTRTEDFITKVRKKGIGTVQALTLETKSSMARDSRIMDEAGQTEQTRLFALLQELSDQRAQDALDLQTSLTALDDQLAKLTTAVPSTAKEIATAQKDIGALGVQRSTHDRVSLVAGFAKSVKADIAAAATAASAASAASPAATPKKPTPVATSSAI